jgi:predicted nucleic acid-binding protein
MKVYLDNVIVSGMTRGDLPAAEMIAVRQMQAASKNGRLEIVCDLFTSRETWREQEKTRNQALRSQFEQERSNVPVVSADHQVTGFHNSQDRLGGLSVCPLVTDIVDDALFRAFKQVGLKDPDARHLMYAVHNGCDRFVTLDAHFLDRRGSLHPLCRGLQIRRPTELVAELAC